MIDYTADITTILDDAGIDVVADGNTFKAVYDNPYAALYDGVVSSSERILYCKSSDVTSLRIGSTVTINTVAYKVIAIEPDGTGLTVIRVGVR